MLVKKSMNIPKSKSDTVMVNKVITPDIFAFIKPEKLSLKM
jgi:hypothetical protein